MPAGEVSTLISRSRRCQHLLVYDEHAGAGGPFYIYVCICRYQDVCIERARDSKANPPQRNPFSHEDLRRMMLSLPLKLLKCLGSRGR